jgi:hypothetical protein
MMQSSPWTHRSSTRRVLVALAAIGVVSLTVSLTGSAAASRAHPAKTPLPLVAEPTTLAVSLDGEGQSGATLTVPDGSYVSANSTLSGINAQTARGTVTYRVYSDSACTSEVASAGVRRVNQPVDSRPLRLMPGTYYWQASYSGDTGDEPSVSPCGSAVETVDGTPLPSACSAIEGIVRGEGEAGPVVVRDHLSTDLGAKQQLYLWSPHTYRLVLSHLRLGWCVAKPTHAYFRGIADARLNGARGDTARFMIAVGKFGQTTVYVRVRNAARELVASITATAPSSSEVLH